MAHKISATVTSGETLFSGLMIDSLNLIRELESGYKKGVIMEFSWVSSDDGSDLW